MAAADRLPSQADWHDVFSARGLFTMLLAGAVATVAFDFFGQSLSPALGFANAGLAERYGSQPAEGVAGRLERELAAILAHGYAPLFLVVADVVHHSRREGIPVSTRGSVANSLVAYCTGITTVDPIAHDLLFERFLNPARSDIPDIDLDFCSRRRDEVLEYVRDALRQRTRRDHRDDQHNAVAVGDP